MAVVFYALAQGYVAAQQAGRVYGGCGRVRRARMPVLSSFKSHSSSTKRTRERTRRRNATFGRRVRVDVVRSELRILSARSGLFGPSARRYKMKRGAPDRARPRDAARRRRGSRDALRALQGKKEAISHALVYGIAFPARLPRCARPRTLRRGPAHQQQKVIGSPTPAPRVLRRLRVWCGTWNMGGCAPPKSLRQWTSPAGVVRTTCTFLDFRGGRGSVRARRLRVRPLPVCVARQGDDGRHRHRRPRASRASSCRRGR